MTTNGLYERSGAAVLDEYELEFPALTVGRRCRVTTGAMKGLEGVVSRARRDKILLEVHLLGQDTLMEINPDRLEPIE
jgi:transcription antitermination factor NusG